MRIPRLCLVLVLFSGSAIAADSRTFDLDRGMGYENGRGAGTGIESPYSVSDGSRAMQSDKLNRLLGMTSDATSSAAYGNLISVTTSPNSAVIVNAQQYNEGSQTVTVDQLRGFGGVHYKNVINPQPLPDYTDQTLMYQQ